MTESVLKDRFRSFALAIFQLTTQFPKKSIYFIVEKQLLRCSSSTGANYRAACRGKSVPDFINKLKIVEEELDETLYCLEYVNGIANHWQEHTQNLFKEGNELLSMMVTSIKTIQRKISK